MGWIWFKANKKYGIVKIKKTGDTDSEDTSDNDKEEGDENEILHAIYNKKMTEVLSRFSAICNNYDADNPEIEYPKGVDLSHDGIYVAVETVKDNIKKWELYWGD